MKSIEYIVHLSRPHFYEICRTPKLMLVMVRLELKSIIMKRKEGKYFILFVTDKYSSLNKVERTNKVVSFQKSEKIHVTVSFFDST